MTDTDLLLTYIAGGLIILGLFVMMYLQRQEVQRLATANEGILSMLNISQKKGEAGENLMMRVTNNLIEAGILEKDVHLPDGLEMDFAAQLDFGATGGRIYIPIDSKVNKKPIKVIEEITKYIGKTYGTGVSTTSFAIVGYPDDEEQKYMEKRAMAREQSVFFVKVSELPIYINFTRWYHDNIAPLESAGPEIARALLLFRNHYVEVEKQVNAVKQKMDKLVESVKFSPIGENLRKTLELVEPISEETQREGDSQIEGDSEPGDDLESATEETQPEGETQNEGDSEPGDDIETAPEETTQISYALPDDLPLAKFNVKGMGKKKGLLKDSGYETVGQMRALSRHDLTEMGFTRPFADKIYLELNRVSETN